MASSAAASLAALGASHPLSRGRVVLATWLLAGLTIGCLARSIRLWSGATAYERLETYELQELEARLCPGMTNSDVRRELGRRGWRPGKIRSVLAGLRPASRGGF